MQGAGDEIYGKATADTGGGSAYLTNIEMDISRLKQISLALDIN